MTSLAYFYIKDTLITSFLVDGRFTPRSFRESINWEYPKLVWEYALVRLRGQQMVVPYKGGR
jgi:hypothetical protein